MRYFETWPLDKGKDVRNGSVERAAAGVVITLREDGTDLVVVNLGLSPLDAVPEGVPVTVVDREGRSARDPADAVLDEIDRRPVDRLVIGIRRRSPVGKALLGSVSQRLLLDSPVPVLAVKPPDH